MSVKVYINLETGQIDKYMPAYHRTEVLDFDINDSLVIDEDTGAIMKIQDSIQGKKRSEYLSSLKELTEENKIELEFLQSK